MSVRYAPVGWNRNKIVYDLVLLAAVVAYLLLFLKIAPGFQDVTRPTSGAILRAQAFGTCAFLMLTFILCIGPLARLDTRFLPLLYNRRHFGVMTCAVAFTHASHVVSIYFSFSPLDKYVAVLASNTSYDRFLGFPFETFGIFALFLLLVLAATSHDFWLRFLTPPIWKAIHISVYVAYAAIVCHVALGALLSKQSPLLAVVVGLSVVAVTGLHLVAGRIERQKDRSAAESADEAPWVVAGGVDGVPDGRGIVVALEDGERVAVFRYGDKLSALANVCAHQNGPLGEGRIMDGCVTCPWHGFQYRPEDGCAPPPFTEKVATYRLKLDGRRIMLDPRPNAPGTHVEPRARDGGVTWQAARPTPASSSAISTPCRACSRSSWWPPRPSSWAAWRGWPSPWAPT